jgi:hypothetical protein
MFSKTPVDSKLIDGAHGENIKGRDQRMDERREDRLWMRRKSMKKREPKKKKTTIKNRKDGETQLHTHEVNNLVTLPKIIAVEGTALSSLRNIMWVANL